MVEHFYVLQVTYRYFEASYTIPWSLHRDERDALAKVKELELNCPRKLIETLKNRFKNTLLSDLPSSEVERGLRYQVEPAVVDTKQYC